MKKIFVTLFIFTLSASAFAQANPKFRKIDSLMNYFTSADKFMGSIAIREKDKVVFEKAYGFSDVAANTKATVDTKYKIGSITKIFTAAIIFQLIEEKKLTLDTKLSQFYPQVKNADSITISDLLSHKSGIYNYTLDPTFPEMLKQQQTKKKMLDRIAAYTPAFKPGEKSDYSNSNYLLLGYIIEDVTGQPYKGNVLTRIVKKIGLKNTYYYSKISPAKKEAYSYTFKDGKWIQEKEWHESVAGAAGALQSTPGDLTQFIDALFDGKVITKPSLDLMKEMQEGYGRGLVQFPFGERRFYGHDGQIEGFSAVLGYYPSDDMSISVISNGLNYDINDIMIGILSSYYKLPYRFPNFATATVAESVLRSYEGIYSTPSLPFKVQIVYHEGKLVAQAEGQGSFELNPLSDTEFNYDPADLRMIFSPKGFTLVQGGTKTEFKREK
jgi:CubicO group peptidase (beta-lactamase class C family)